MKKILWMLGILALLGYGAYESRRLIGGPSIVVETPINGSAVSAGVVTIAGIARNISFLTINDAPAFTDKTGHFTTQLSPPPGYAIFTIAATDRFGRQAREEVHITVLNYCPVIVG